MLNQLQVPLLLLIIAINLGAAVHALMTKREPTAAAAWLLTCLIFPLAGPALYFLFGINRVRTRARKLRAESTGSNPQLQTALEQAENPLIAGNRITPLINGEQAYPRMLEAIANAKERLFLSSYIFDSDATGQEFIQTLAAAVRRGVDVRVILDGIGEWYSLPRASRQLRRAGIPVVRFLPPRLLPPTLLINLRNHRKILVADGTIAFTGGINIGDRHLVMNQTHSARVADVHFQMEGPVVSQIEQLFVRDWVFCHKQAPTLQPVEQSTAGNTMCRVIADGPDLTLDAIIMVLIGAISQARQRVLIMTPYFLPPRELLVALKSAALRGVAVELVLPGKNNFATVHWACRHMLGEILESGVNVSYQPPPFVHSKLFVVDEEYALIGSANLDARSLRLNFEVAVECHDAEFAGQLAEHILAAQRRSDTVTLDQLHQRPPLIRLRDALAWLMTPYL